MRSAALLLSLLSINLAASLPAPDPDSIDMDYHINTKRQSFGWCTFHYSQVLGGPSIDNGISRLTVYGAVPSGVSPPLIAYSWAIPYGAISPLPGFGDFLLAQNDNQGNVTFRRQGVVSGDTWTILQTDLGDNLGGHQCSVGKWGYTSREMDCGFECTPYNYS